MQKQLSRGVTSQITLSAAGARLADIVDAARVDHDPVYLTRRGQRMVAAAIDADDLDNLVALVVAVGHRREVHERR